MIPPQGIINQAEDCTQIASGKVGSRTPFRVCNIRASAMYPPGPVLGQITKGLRNTYFAVQRHTHSGPSGFWIGPDMQWVYLR